MRGLFNKLHRGVGGSGAGGFSLVEVLVALAIFLFVLAIVFVFFVDYGRSLNSESSILDMQVTARVALDEIARNVQQAGYNIDRTKTGNPTVWQRDLIYAGSHVLGFNADIDVNRGPIPATEVLSFPTGETYAGEGPPTTIAGAETYVYTIDADDDNALTTSDRTAAATGSYNPASETETPMDFALFKKVYGWDGSAYGGALVPISPHLFTNATTDAKYPADNSSPRPLFQYLLTEDLDGNNVLANGECVVEPCPPSSTRKPVLYRWGDTNFDGTLSESEKDNIRDKPVGSPLWTKNRLAASGAYKSTTLTANVTPGASSAYVLNVADASKLAPGVYIQIGTGGSAETAMVESISTSSNTVVLVGDPEKAQSSGATVTILPQTLLRAVRAVQIGYDAITPKADVQAGVARAGRMGHEGTRGLDYRVKQFEKTVELVNLQTAPLFGSKTSGTPTCPLTLTAVCGSSPISQVTGFTPSAAPIPLGFIVKDSGNLPVEGVPVDFTQSNSSIGAFNGLTSVKSADTGVATINYTASGPIGDSVVTAKGTCANSSNQLVYFTSTLTVKSAKANITMAKDCLGTVGPSVSTSAANFTIQVVNSSGAVVDSPVLVGLSVDPASIASPADYTKVEGELFLEGSSVGTTGTTGILSGVSATTGPGGYLSGQVVLTKDVTGEGVRFDLSVTPVGGLCWPSGATVKKPVTFYKLGLDSSYPGPGCSESSPCIIPAGSLSPIVLATLTLNGQPVQNASVTFTKTDFQSVPGSPPAASTFVPSATTTTNSSGVATVYVGNNGAASITPSNPLQATISATSQGDPSYCTSGDIAYAGLRPQFYFEGSVNVGTCDADIQPSYVSIIAGKNDQVCINVLNPSSSRACPMSLSGIKVTYFAADGITPDASRPVRSISGGAITAVQSCTNSGAVPLYDPKCNTNLNLAPGVQWTFTTVDKCRPAPGPVPAGNFFVIDNLKFNGAIKGTGRRIDYTIYFGCSGLCTSTPLVKTFSTVAPP